MCMCISKYMYVGGFVREKENHWAFFVLSLACTEKKNYIAEKESLDFTTYELKRMQ